jgi:hypothetical protein
MRFAKLPRRAAQAQRWAASGYWVALAGEWLHEGAPGLA